VCQCQQDYVGDHELIGAGTEEDYDLDGKIPRECRILRPHANRTQHYATPALKEMGRDTLGKS